jgi:hypothetical protein
VGTRYTAKTNETTTLNFLLVHNGTLVDAHEVRQVTIHATYQDALNDTNIIQVITSANITRVATGHYAYTAAILSTAGSYFDKVFLTPVSGQPEISFINDFSVNNPAQPGADQRQGFFFNNPITSDHYYPGWGMLVTPDEIRYVVTFGAKLVSSDAFHTYTDEMLQTYIDNAIGVLEADFGLDIYPRIVRYDDPIGSDGVVIPRNLTPGEANQVREMGYPYKRANAEYYMYVKLRRRPLQDVLDAKMVDPLGQNSVIDLFPMRIVKKGLDSRVQFFPRSTVPVAAGYPWLIAGKGFFNYPFDNYPDAIKIDYKTGWANAAAVPKDIAEAIRKIAGIYLLMDYGDGKTSGVASQSVSMNSISEAYTTGMSATSGMYTERVIEFAKELKQWYKINKARYKRNQLGVLG